jgi:hypothetical protein
MAEEDRITMSQKESNRLYVIRQAIDKAINQEQAAALLKLSDRRSSGTSSRRATPAFVTSPGGREPTIALRIR